MSEIDLFLILFVEFPTYGLNKCVLLTNKTKKKKQKKKRIKSKKYSDFGRKQGKLASNLKINITKIGKTLKSGNL